ncbi:hypothetical protein, partial [Enterococcus sp. HPCN18]|uniref:hypothetical protein n=1 Tax=Enterococcus sp. HPCN18 TaxID=2248751 RepID=UPI001C660677
VVHFDIQIDTSVPPSAVGERLIDTTGFSEFHELSPNPRDWKFIKPSPWTFFHPTPLKWFSIIC